MTAPIRTNCPRDCYDGCGIVITPGDADQIRVLGDPDHPISQGRLCGKCALAYNGVWQDATARLTTPLKRSGAKGSGEFVPITWEQALSEIADRFNGIIANHSARAILSMQYTGTLSLLAHHFPTRLVNKLGLAEVDYGTICNSAGCLAWELLFGTAYQGFDPRTLKDSQCLFLWGVNPAHSAPHMFDNWIQPASAKVVVIDPIRTATADAADLHLKLKPGTDAALAFALLHAIRELGGFDGDFIASHTVGADELATHIDACTPLWAEGVTGVRADDIRLAAQMYLAGPAMLWVGQGLQRQPGGGNVMRAAGLLPALTGNVGKPGSGFCYLNATAMLAGADMAYLTGSGLASTQREKVGALDLADRLWNPDEFKAFIVWNTNPLASCSNQQRLREACTREDLFTVVIDCFPTDTARYADIVLPAASFLEFDDITYSYFNLLIGAQAKVREPIGEALPNQQIFRRLAGAMGLTDAALLEPDTQIIATLLTQMKIDLDFNELKARGHVRMNGDDPIVFFADRRFPTSSGKIEIASAKATQLGLPRIPEPRVDPLPAPGTVRLLSPASKWRLNDIHGNEPKIDQRVGPAELLICKEDAARYGIEDGGRVRVRSAIATLTLTARLSDAVQPGMVVSYKGRWPQREPEERNLNALYAGIRADMAESSAVHALTVRLTPA
ncbi:MAG: molybdopterin-dependent oxidoreductase [Proteobacteria bacterium]|nr:molybdopterin-dependent oxidoreductase [Pseudomonadota bacterium]